MGSQVVPYCPVAIDRLHLYIMDFRNEGDEGTQVGRRTIPTSHQLKCNTVKDLFEDYTNAEIHEVRFERGTRSAGVLNYWRNEMASKSDDELVIIYYHGKAGIEKSTNDEEENDFRWSFKFQGFPNSPINAYKLVKTIDGHKPNVLFLLDCDIPTRLPTKFHRTLSNTEIIGAGGFVSTCLGREVQEGLGDFTYALCSHLTNFVEGINKKYRGWKKLTTIPKLMAKDRELWNNPKRVWLDRTNLRAQHPKLVERIKINPLAIRAEADRLEAAAAGILVTEDPVEKPKLKFVSVVIQGSRYPTEDADAMEQSADEQTAEEQTAEEHTAREQSVEQQSTVANGPGAIKQANPIIVEDDGSDFEDEALVGDVVVLDEHENPLFC